MFYHFSGCLCSLCDQLLNRCEAYKFCTDRCGEDMRGKQVEDFYHSLYPFSYALGIHRYQGGFGQCLVPLVAAEMLSATAGLGYMIQQGRALGRSDIIIVGMLTIGVIGAVLTAVLNKLENRVIRWRAK